MKTFKLFGVSTYEMKGNYRTAPTGRNHPEGVSTYEMKGNYREGTPRMAQGYGVSTYEMKGNYRTGLFLPGPGRV